MTSTYAFAAAGGVLIGLSSLAMMAFLGRIAGISGIFFNAFTREDGPNLWRLSFLAGLLLGAPATAWLLSRPITEAGASPRWALIAGGLLVGFGTRLGTGCTSGHGVCGVGRLALRSLFATALFMAAGILTVSLLRVGGFLS